MILNLIFSGVFILSVIYIIRYRISIKKAAELSLKAYYPSNKEEFDRIVAPAEWKTMEPLSKNSKSYRWVKWGTILILLLLGGLMFLVLWSHSLEPYVFNVGYIFFILLNSIKHHGNFYLLTNGLILNGRFYTWNQLKNYKVEKIHIGHELYGLDDKINNRYKLAVEIKKRLVQPGYIVVTDYDELEKIIHKLHEQRIEGNIQIHNTYSQAIKK